MDIFPENIDNVAKDLQEINRQIDALKARKQKLEIDIIDELDKRSSITNWATHLAGKKYEIIRSAKNHINPDDLRASLGEWIEPDELDRLIRKEHEKIVIEPAKVKLTEVNKLKKQGGMLAEQIEKVTRRTVGSIRIENKGVSDDNN
jgi:hypothetical protein